MNIVEAIKDQHLFRPFLGDLKSWKAWLIAMRALYGLPIQYDRGRRLVRACTGRRAATLPKRGFDTALFLTGRRSGKSRMAAVIGAFEAAIAGHERKLSPGETGVVAVISPTRYQSRIVKTYLRGIFQTPLLHSEVVREERDSFTLKNGTRIEILAGDWRTVRGYTLLAAIVDEACFLGVDADAKVRSDTELVRAIQPGLATVNGKLICISSPYARRGWCHDQWKRHYGNADGTSLVWNCPSRTMNPLLKQSTVDAALQEDYAAARSEWLGEWRDDVSHFLPRNVIEDLVVAGREELLPDPDRDYFAFVDPSGGRHDHAVLAIAHKQNRKVVIDSLSIYKPPFNPHEVIWLMAEHAKKYGVRRVVGDNYAAEFVAASFRSAGIRYTRADKHKSQLYLELLPRLCSGEVELLDNESLVTQLASLERRTRSGGKDIVDHPAGGRDDVANAVAGVCEVASARRVVVGAVTDQTFTQGVY